MTHQDKIQTVEALERFIAQKGSQNQVAAGMAGVSAATLSQMRNHKWDLIADEMWRKVAAYVGASRNVWNFADTKASMDLLKAFEMCQYDGQVKAVVGRAGSGKTITAHRYAGENKNVFILSCNEYWDKKWFMRELLGKIGKNHAGLSVPEMMNYAVERLLEMDRPMIILDEADKLADAVLYFFITLYNSLFDPLSGQIRCGIVLMATNYLEKKIKKGTASDKRGYEEVLSRVDRKFFELYPTTFSDVEKVCAANGIQDNDAVRAIYKECQQDMRRVRGLIFSNRRAKDGI